MSEQVSHGSAGEYQADERADRADGAGYAFLAEKVLDVDRLNPQVSARLLGAFRSYRALEPNRMRLASEALAKVAATPGISRDLGEIVGRMLED